LAKEEKNPKDIEFKAEKALDRAKLNSDVMSSRLSSDEGKEIRSVDKVIREARRYYSESYRGELGKIDPAYAEDSFYDYSNNNASADNTVIAKKIDSGEAITGKEIFKMAEDSAKKASESVKELKSSEVIKIIERVGLDNIEGADKYYELVEKFDAILEDTTYSYAKALQGLKNYLENKEEPEGKDLLELNAIVSMLASVLKENGFKSESIDKESADYIKKIELFAASDTEDSLEGNKEKEKGKEEVAEAVIKTEENKLAEAAQKENKEQGTQVNTAVTEKKSEQSAEDALLVSKSGSAVTEEPKNKVEEEKLESVIEKPESKKSEGNTPEIKESTKTTGDQTKGPEVSKTETPLEKSSESPIKDIFKGTFLEGLIGTIKPEGDKKIEENKSVVENLPADLIKPSEAKEPGNKLESTTANPESSTGPTAAPSPMATATENKLETPSATVEEKPSDNNSLGVTETPKLESPKIETLAPLPLAPLDIKENMNLAVEKPDTKPVEKKKGKIASAISRVIEKIKDKPETISEDKSIKLAEPQKLSVKAPEIKKEESKESPIETDKPKEIEQKPIASDSEKTEKSVSAENKTTNDKEINVVVDNKSLEEKMDHMIALLSMLNETLQGPLLVSSNNKNFE
jgi:hypothetical protein